MPAKPRKQRIAKLKRRVTPHWNRFALTMRGLFRPQSSAHGRKREVIVSLTSYPARFATLHLTLKSLLLQSVSPDMVVLWIAHQDEKKLPTGVRKLTSAGLHIMLCDDLKSFKKIIPALTLFPGADIVTADDDVYYWRDWLKELLEASNRHPGDVIAHRTHRIVLDDEGRPRPYREWLLNIKCIDPDPLNFATGTGGVLYPSGCFHPDVLDINRFMSLCPAADDVWLYWMVRRNGGIERHSNTNKTPTPWRGSQRTALWRTNKLENDEQINRMLDAYGFPNERN
jgi:hypothetical protein